MLGKDVFPKDRARVSIETEHRGVQGKNILRGGLRRARARAADDDIHVSGQLGLRLGSRRVRSAARERCNQQ
jgi:hypothetical protein